MVVAAYLVGGFLIASVYAAGDAAGPDRPLPPARLRHRRSPSPRSRPRSRWASATRWRAGCTTTSRSSSPRSSWCRRPESDVPETLLGHLNADGTVTGGIPIPGLASWLSDPSTGKSTVVQGLDSVPADDRPTVRRGQRRPPRVGRHGRPRHAAVPAVGLVRRQLGRSAGGCRPSQVVPARSPPAPACSPWSRMEAGWVVTEVGRQPWIVYNLMKVEDAATANTGVWITFIAVVAALRRARRHHDPGAARDEPAVPAGRRLRRPRHARTGRSRRRRAASRDRRGGRSPMSDRRRGRPAARPRGVRRVRRRRLRRRLLGPDRRRPRAGRAAARADRALDRAGVGGQPRLADLHLRRDLDRVPDGVRLDHADAVRPAHHRRARHRPARGELRVPQVGRRRCATAGSSAARSPLSSVLVPFCMGAVAGGIASGQVPAGGKAGDPVDSWLNPTSIVTGVLAVAVAAYLAAVYLVWDARRADDADAGRVLPPPRRGRRPSWPPWSPRSAWSSCTPRRRTSSTA